MCTRWIVQLNRRWRCQGGCYGITGAVQRTISIVAARSVHHEHKNVLQVPCSNSRDCLPVHLAVASVILKSLSAWEGRWVTCFQWLSYESREYKSVLTSCALTGSPSASIHTLRKQRRGLGNSRYTSIEGASKIAWLYNRVPQMNVKHAQDIQISKCWKHILEIALQQQLMPLTRQIA